MTFNPDEVVLVLSRRDDYRIFTHQEEVFVWFEHVRYDIELVAEAFNSSFDSYLGGLPYIKHVLNDLPVLLRLSDSRYSSSEVARMMCAGLDESAIRALSDSDVDAELTKHLA